MVLIAGEAGVGKSRLINEAVRWAAERDIRVLRGNCLRLGSGAVPMGPMLDALRPLATGSSREEVDKLLGQPLAERLLALGQAPAMTPAPGISAETVHGQLVEASAGAFAELARRGATLLVIEDVQWIDRSSIDVCTLLTRWLVDGRLAIILSLRSDEPLRDGHLLNFIAELSRLDRYERVDLERLHRGEIARQVEAIRQEPAPPDLVDAIYARCQGNPFFAEELLAVLREPGGDTLPRTLEAVLGARLGRLGEDAIDLVRAASVAGSPFDEDLLAGLFQRPAAAFHAALREAVGEHLLIREPGPQGAQLAFRHALLAELVYAELPKTERRALHGACARLIEARMGTTADVALSSRLAHHWDAAEDAGRALEAAVRAARIADAVGARPEAARHYERVLELTANDDPTRRFGELDRIALLERAAANRIDNPAVAVAHVRAALDLADPADVVRVGLLTSALGRYLWFAGDGAGALAACREAIQLVPREPPTSARAHVAAGLGQILMILAHTTPEASAACEEAVELARATGERAIESHALNTLGVLTAYAGDVQGGIARLRAALEIDRETGNALNRERAYSNLVDVLVYAAANYGEAIDVARQALDGRDPRNPALHDGLLRADLLAALILSGRWDEAATELELTRRGRHHGAAEIAVRIREAQLLVGRGDLDEARIKVATLEDMLRTAADTQWISPATLVRSELELWTGEPRAALAAARTGLERLEPARGANVTRVGPVLAAGIRAAGDIVHAASGSDEALHARRSAYALLDEMRETRARLAESWPAHLWLADRYLALCEAEAGRVNGASEPTAWAAAVNALDELRQPYASAYARYRHAEALVSGRRAVSRARPILAEAHATAMRLGAKPLMAACRDLAEAAHIDLGAGAARATDGRPAGLSTREQQVVQLVAAGLTNRQIADRLFITPKTAGHHVSSILGKLGVSRRTEAAAEAVRLGIAPARSADEEATRVVDPPHGSQTKDGVE